MDAFDADVLVYAATKGHALGRRVARLFDLPKRPGRSPGAMVGTGSVLLIPELLAKPLRDGREDEIEALAFLLVRLDLRPVDRMTAELAAVLGGRYRLRAVDATHLAAAVVVGAERFITNNRRDFRRHVIGEIDVTYPEDLREPRTST